MLKEAQEAACAAVVRGVTAEAVDAVARGLISVAATAVFVHRTGHGIGLETHEDPQIVAGNSRRCSRATPPVEGPGIYPGPHGARI